MGVKKGQDVKVVLDLNTSGVGDYVNNRSLDNIKSYNPNSREFLFGLSLHLGLASNNYAEYTGLILAQLIFSMFKQTVIAVMTDSTLIVNQVKGIAMCKNIRLVELIKIVSL